MASVMRVQVIAFIAIAAYNIHLFKNKLRLFPVRWPLGQAANSSLRYAVDCCCDGDYLSYSINYWFDSCFDYQPPHSRLRDKPFWRFSLLRSRRVGSCHCLGVNAVCRSCRGLGSRRAGDCSHLAGTERCNGSLVVLKLRKNNPWGYKFPQNFIKKCSQSGSYLEQGFGIDTAVVVAHHGLSQSAFRRAHWRLMHFVGVGGLWQEHRLGVSHLFYLR